MRREKDAGRERLARLVLACSALALAAGPATRSCIAAEASGSPATGAAGRAERAEPERSDSPSGASPAKMAGTSESDSRRVRSVERAATAARPTSVLRMKLADPVLPSAPPRLYNVVLSRDSNGFPLEYSLSFETEVCRDGKCQPVAVTMVWSAVGRFERLRYPAGKPLTKKDDAPFTAEDYAKLDRILKDRDSILADWTLDYLERPEEPGDDPDAVSSPTPIEAREAVIENAAYTTWALWHWANGEIVPKLLAVTRRSCAPKYLNHLLASADRSCVDFALDYILERHPTDPQFVDSVRRILETGDHDEISRALEFLERAIPDARKRQACLIDSLARMRPADCPMILQELAAERELPAAACEDLTGLLPQLPYFPIHLILRMLEERKFSSKKTVSDVAALLDSDNFFIARRAYEHLIKQDLDAATQKKVDAFRRRNRDRL